MRSSNRFRRSASAACCRAARAAAVCCSAVRPASSAKVISSASTTSRFLWRSSSAAGDGPGAMRVKPSQRHTRPRRSTRRCPGTRLCCSPNPASSSSTQPAYARLRVRAGGAVTTSASGRTPCGKAAACSICGRLTQKLGADAASLTAAGAASSSSNAAPTAVSKPATTCRAERIGGTSPISGAVASNAASASASVLSRVSRASTTRCASSAECSSARRLVMSFSPATTAGATFLDPPFCLGKSGRCGSCRFGRYHGRGHCSALPLSRRVPCFQARAPVGELASASFEGSAARLSGRGGFSRTLQCHLGLGEARPSHPASNRWPPRAPDHFPHRLGRSPSSPRPAERELLPLLRAAHSRAAGHP